MSGIYVMCNNVASDVTKLMQHLIKTTTCSCTIEKYTCSQIERGEREGGREGERERVFVCHGEE